MIIITVDLFVDAFSTQTIFFGGEGVGRGGGGVVLVLFCFVSNTAICRRWVSWISCLPPPPHPGPPPSTPNIRIQIVLVGLV